MENVAIISDHTSLYVAKETGPSSNDLSEDSRDTANLFLRRAKLNEFLVTSRKTVVAQPKKPWSQMLDALTKQVYIDKAKDAVVAALEVIIPDDAGGLWEALNIALYCRWKCPRNIQSHQNNDSRSSCSAVYSVL